LAGWGVAGRHLDPATRNLIVNIGTSQSLAVRSGKHSPLVFDDPSRFRREGTDEQKRVMAGLAGAGRHRVGNTTLDFLGATARNAADSSDFVRQASAAYRTPVDYGIGNAFGGGLQRVAALIAAGMKTRIYYVVYQGNAFDTHVQQGDVHSRLLMYTADAVRAFIDDVARLGRADDVSVLMFTEFGRRVEENGSLGTDHGTATPMFLFGKQVKGGFYGPPPEPHGSGRRQPEDDHGFPPRLRHRHQGVDGVRRHGRRAEGEVRNDRRVHVGGPDRSAATTFAPAGAARTAGAAGAKASDTSATTSACAPCRRLPGRCRRAPAPAAGSGAGTPGRLHRATICAVVGAATAALPLRNATSMAACEVTGSLPGALHRARFPPRYGGPSFSMMRARCVSTVLGLMNSSAAISLLVLPSATSWKISRSRSESDS
jgi:hypothetical protein